MEMLPVQSYCRTTTGFCSERAKRGKKESQMRNLLLEREWGYVIDKTYPSMHFHVADLTVNRQFF